MAAQATTRSIMLNLPKEVAGKLERHAASMGISVGELVEESYSVYLREQLREAFQENCAFLEANGIEEVSLQQAVEIVRAQRNSQLR